MIINIINANGPSSSMHQRSPACGCKVIQDIGLAGGIGPQVPSNAKAVIACLQHAALPGFLVFNCFGLGPWPRTLAISLLSLSANLGWSCNKRCRRTNETEALQGTRRARLFATASRARAQNPAHAKPIQEFAVPGTG